MYRNLLVTALLIGLGFSNQIAAQNTAAVIGTSYDPIDISKGSPGQLVTFSISGVGQRLTGEVIADKLPLPTVLAGISISLDFETNFIPLLRIEPLQEGVVLVTAQIPFEAPLSGPRFHVVFVIADGKVITSTRFNLVENDAHILRTCDTLFSQRAGTCDTWLVFHLNGRLVTADDPARPSETLVLYAVGLGVPEGAAKTGEATVVPGPVPRLNLDFNFTPNALPKNITKIDERLLTKPLFAGLAPGLVGLYQVNFQVPATVSASLPRCDEVTRSNLTITIGLPLSSRSGGSFDGARICVQP